MTRGPNWIEVAAVVATAVLHLLLSNALGLQGVTIAIALLGWTSYALWQARRDRHALDRWGFTRRGLGPAFVATTLFAVLAIGIMALVGYRNGTLQVDGGLIALLLLYPAWGLIQQFLVQALVAGNLRRASGWIRHPVLVVLVCAVLFGLVHLPDVRLAGATFLLGLVFTPLYLRWRNLWPLGLYHGWLGAFCYRWVLDRNPWLEIAGGG